MWKIAGITIVVLIAAVVAFAATRPDTFRVERSVTIQAPPAKVYALLDDFRQWSQWSPWERVDPDMKRIHGGPARGKGALYGWDGNKAVGKGQMEIIDADAGARVLIKLDFLEPFEAHNTAEFTLAPQGDATRVTWAMSGPNLFLGKVMGLFASMDSIVGPDFERGLANLKAVAEK